jgi:hypothetical protein
VTITCQVKSRQQVTAAYCERAFSTAPTGLWCVI